MNIEELIEKLKEYPPWYTVVDFDGDDIDVTISTTEYGKVVITESGNI